MVVANTHTPGSIVARFFNALKDGHFVAAYCKKCQFFLLPPQSVCGYCFSSVDELEEIEPVGKLCAFTGPLHLLSFQIYNIVGKKLSDNLYIGWIEFPQTKGGFIHFVETDGHRPVVSTQVIAEFKPKRERTGSLLDIRCFKKYKI